MLNFLKKFEKQNVKQLLEFMYIFKKSFEFEILTGGHAGPERK
jgi:hypothetical protein